MAKLNTSVKNPANRLRTYEGAPAKHINKELALRRSVMSCMLWEDTFYEDGQEISERIRSLIPFVKPEVVAQIAKDARWKMKLRHVPLWIIRAMAECDTHKHLVKDTLYHCIGRADELTEFVAMYWKKKKEPLSAQVKKGLAKAFTKFDAYQLAKYNRDGKVKLKDVLFLSHAKPENEEQAATWKKLIDGTLAAPDTWEVALSGTKGKDKDKEWNRLLDENKLGGMALLRNLRNMREVGIGRKKIYGALDKASTSLLLPFRFISAANAAPEYEPKIEEKMLKALKGRKPIKGYTAIAVDCSWSMEATVSEKSKISRNDAACALAIFLRELCVDGCDVFAYGSTTEQVPARRGFALRDAIKAADPGWATYLGACVKKIQHTGKYDRVIIVTDEQSRDRVPDPRDKGYIINVAPYKNGVGYGAWTHIDGWSEATLDFIRELETNKGES